MGEAEEDKMLKAMGRLERAELEALDPRLERLAAGRLTDAEHRQLLHDAARDPELARDVALHAPMSAEAQNKLYSAASAARRARVIRLPWVGTAMALAAALAVTVVASWPDPLPTYQVRWSPGEATLRSADAPPTATFRVDGIIRVHLIPDEVVDGAVESSLYVRAASSPPRPWRETRSKAEAVDSGAFVWHVRAGTLSEERAGIYDVVAVVRRPGCRLDASALRVEPSGGRCWRSTGRRIVVRPIDER